MDIEENPFADPEKLNLLTEPTIQQKDDNEPPTDYNNDNPFKTQNQSELPDDSPPLTPVTPTQLKQTKKSETQRLLSPGLDPTPTLKDTDIQQREEEVARKEKELLEREKNMAKRGMDSRPKNFPPFPKWFPCQPCFYINIAEEIPKSERWKIFSLIALLFAYTFLLFLNLLFSLPGAVYAMNDDSKLGSGVAILAVVLATVWLFVFPALALFCWFMPVYTAIRKDSSLGYMLFFFVMVVQLVIWVILGLGPPGFSCGIISGTELIRASKVVGGMFMTLGFIWFILVPFGSILIYLIHRYYRSSGGTLDKAIGEASKKAATNKYLKNAVKDSVKTGLNAATSQ